MKIVRSIEWIAFTVSSAVILYAVFGVFVYLLGPESDDYCRNARGTGAENRRGVVAEAMARWCAFTGLPNERRMGLHLSDESGDAVLVYYERQNNRDAPVLQWIDDQHLRVDLGEVNWLTPQISHLGRVTISYTYSGAEPSLE